MSCIALLQKLPSNVKRQLKGKLLLLQSCFPSGVIIHSEFDFLLVFFSQENEPIPRDPENYKGKKCVY